MLKERLLKEETKAIVGSKLAPYLNATSQPLANEFFQILYETVRSDYPENTTEFLKLSERERLSILSKIEEYLAFDETQIIEAEKRIKKSIERKKFLRTKADSKEVLSSEIYLSKKNHFLTQIDELRKRALELTVGKAGANHEFTEAAQAFHKVSTKYKEVLKAHSVNDISARAFLAFDELRKNLFAKYISRVEGAFIRNINLLLTKERLLDGIYISESFEVVPYKQEKISTSYIRALIDDAGEDYAKERLGERAFAAFESSGALDEYIELPIKIEQHFSAGEQQIYAMALYQALAELRSSEIPFVIDTQLARIDRVHRKNILNNFFLELPGQVIILSTDEEIDVSSLKMIQPKLADLYLIEHRENIGTVILRNQYFEEVFR
jgi:hypothetical protein